MSATWPPRTPLLDTTVDPPHYGWPPIISAANTNKTSRLTKVLHSGAHPDDVGLDGRSALHWQVLLGDDRIGIARKLLAAGASPHVQCRGQTPLQYAKRFHRPRLAELLAKAEESMVRHPRASRWRMDTLTPLLALSPPGSAPAPPRASSATGLPAPLSCCLHACHGRGSCVNGECSCLQPHNSSRLDCAARSHLHAGSSSSGEGGFRGEAVWSSSRARSRRFRRSMLYRPAGGGGRLDPRTNRSSITRGEASSGCPMRRQNGVYIGELGLAISRARPTRPGRRGECTPFPVTTIDPDVNGIYAPLDVFLLRLLDDPTFRAPSAECAEAVWHPLFARRLYGNVNEVLKWRLKAALATKRALSPEGKALTVAARVGEVRSCCRASHTRGAPRHWPVRLAFGRLLPRRLGANPLGRSGLPSA